MFLKLLFLLSLTSKLMFLFCVLMARGQERDGEKDIHEAYKKKRAKNNGKG